MTTTPSPELPDNLQYLLEYIPTPAGRAEAARLIEDYALARRAQPEGEAPQAVSSKRLREEEVREIALQHLHDDTESAGRNGWFKFSAEGLDGFAIDLMDRVAAAQHAENGAQAMDLRKCIRSLAVLVAEEGIKAGSGSTMSVASDKVRAVADGVLAWERGQGIVADIEAAALAAQSQGANPEQATAEVDEHAAFEAWNNSLGQESFGIRSVPNLPPAAWAAWQARAALASRPAEVDDEAARLRKVLVDVRQALQFANDSPNGGISDTLWMMHSPETVFDFIDAALAEQYRQGQRDAVAADRARRQKGGGQ